MGDNGQSGDAIGIRLRRHTLTCSLQPQPQRLAAYPFLHTLRGYAKINDFDKASCGVQDETRTHTT